MLPCLRLAKLVTDSTKEETNDSKIVVYLVCFAFNRVACRLRGNKRTGNGYISGLPKSTDYGPL
jgi:hypothetical protein